jgi:haloacetate dehalogenase
MQHAGLAYEITGEGPAIVLLHGFPQCRAMWDGIVPKLAGAFTCVTLDLPGYGESDGGQSVDAASFRAMAARVVALLDHLGLGRVHLVGHDRGGRLAHRLALDAPDRVASLVLMDIVPTHLLVTELRAEVARAYYHWFFLAQPAPFPETLIGHDPDAYFESCLVGWGKDGLDAFDARALETYRAHWRRPEVIHAMCNDYRAALDIDVGHDAADLDRRVACPALVLYGRDGKMAEAYDVPATWADRLADMCADALPGGHFFPDTHPARTARALRGFLEAL